MALIPHLHEPEFFDAHFGHIIHPDILKSLVSLPAKLRLAELARNTSPWAKVTNDGVQVSIDVQHFLPNEITVKATDNIIVVEGKHDEKDDHHGSISRHFVRKYNLPDTYDLADLNITLSSDGLLTLEAHKKTSHNEHVLPIHQTGLVNKAGQSKKISPWSRISNEGLKVSLDVQQFKPNEITVRTMDNVVVVEGKHEEREDHQGTIYRNFVRKYNLPADIDVADLKITMSSDGLLTLEAHKKNSHFEHVIPILETGPDMDQWAMNMNPAFYQGMPNANVDWAQLAAQWIHMRETLPPEQHNLMPSAPPPPKISLIENNVGANSYKQYGDEKGEAPMEVVKESDDDYMPNFNTTTNAISNQMPLVAPQPPVISAWGNTLESNNVQQLNQNWRNPAWQVYETNQTQSHPIINSTMLSKPPPLCPELQGYSGGRRRWSNKAPGNEIPFAAMNQMPAPISEEQTNENENLETLDAAKRKTLPAWIREGLEKMEREKQREEERIKMEEERKRLAEERRKFEAEALHELESTQNLQSKFDNSEDESEYDQESRPASPDPSKNEIPKPIQKVPSPVKNEFVPTRSREEQMQELMLSVRKSLTEILLEVTNEEIRNIARETHTRLKNKNIFYEEKLLFVGLGIYGSESESSDDDADKSDKDDSSAIDSENEIRETMKRKKANFERVIDEIEDYLEKEELAELSRKREWDRKYGFDMERRKQEENRPSSSNSSSSSDSNPRKEINNSGNNKKYNHQQSNESTSGNNNYNNEKNTKRNISDKGEPHHSTDYNSRSSGSRHKARVSRFSDPRDKVAPAELAVQTAKLQKSEHKSKRPNSDENYARTTSNTNVRLDMNQFLRREVTKDMLELLNQVKRARSRSSDSRSTSSSARRSHKKHSKHSSKKSRHRSSSSSSSSTSSSSDSSSRKHKKKSKSSRSKSDKKRRSRSRSRESHRSGKSSSKRTRSRSRDRRSYR
uniref:CSON002511 protein n=1 Tax=Culicoides sonorensis TaxID=179676 RepID=A0A336K7E4_CULSO